MGDLASLKTDAGSIRRASCTKPRKSMTEELLILCDTRSSWYRPGRDLKVVVPLERCKTCHKAMSESSAQGARQSLAPIALFAFRRPLETLQTLWALSRCPESQDSDVYIYCDGARGDRDQAGVRQTREVVRQQRWLPRVTVIERDSNWGLARSIVHGVSQACEQHGRVIVIEDDLLVSMGFLRYMNAALDRYAEDDRVMQVSGHSFPIYRGEASKGPGVARLLPVATTWGWATWARAWKHYNHAPDISSLSDPRIAHSFDLDSSYPYSPMLRSAVSGSVDSWGIRWWWAVFQRGGLGLFPFPSLVKNCGFSAGATNTTGAVTLMDVDFDLDGGVSTFPDSPLVDEQAFSRWKQYLVALKGRPRWSDLLKSQRVRQVARRILAR